MSRNFNPCKDHCYLKYKRQYVPEKCDAACDYAADACKRKRLEKAAKSAIRFLETDPSDECIAALEAVSILQEGLGEFDNN